VEFGFDSKPSECVMAKLGQLHEALHAWDANILNKPQNVFKKLRGD
jgi:hypothetical protein